MARKRKHKALAPAVAQVRDRIEHWRRTRTVRRPMPAELWQAAVAVARKHGVFCVSRALRLNYNDLKKRLQTGARKGQRSPSGFVELSPPVVAAAALPQGVVVEWTRARGDKMTIRLSGAEQLDVVGLARAFWSGKK